SDGNARRPRHEIAADAAAGGVDVLEMARPPAPKPSHVERRRRPVAGAALRENRSYAGARRRRLADDPIAVLAHNCEAVMHDGLAGREHRHGSEPVDLAREIEVD